VYRRSLLILIFGCITSAFADSAVQTDWSGGPGVQGPAPAWGNSFQYSWCTEWFEQPGSLQLAFFTTTRVYGITWWSSRASIAIHSDDFDGDGDSDIIESGIRSVYFWENSESTGIDWVRHTVDSVIVAASLSSADLDGDGNADILGACEDENRIYGWRNPGSSGTEWTRFEICSFSEVSLVCTADIDGDGDTDVIGAGLFGIAWWENVDSSGSIWTYHSLAGSYEEARSLYVDDIDGDGDVDALAGVGPDITWWENVGGTGLDWTSHNVTDSYSTVRSASMTDLDNDGDQDILAVSFTAFSVTWWENVDGSCDNWIAHPVASIYLPTSAYSADMDYDGDIDVVCAGWSPGTMSWWENIGGAGTDWVCHDIDEPRSRMVIPADVNGDGFLDVVGSVYESGLQSRVEWYNFRCYQYSSYLYSSILSTGSSPDWDLFEWSADTPPGTSVEFAVRASNNSSDMGSWSDTLTCSCSLSGIIEDGRRYFQYMAILQSDDQRFTPLLHDVSVSWDSLESVSRPPETGTSPLCLFPFTPNPSAGSPAVRFSLAEPASVELSIFDLSGRLVSDIYGENYSTGYHDVLLEDLSPGLYFCRMISGDFQATQRFVVIE